MELEQSSSSGTDNVKFLTMLMTNYEKLENPDIVNIIWKEMLMNERDPENIDALIEYTFHYPVDLEAYLHDLSNCYNDCDVSKLREVDGHFKAYIITFLYHCTSNSNDNNVSANVKLIASMLYLKMIGLSGTSSNVFYEPNMYEAQLLVAIDFMKEDSITDSSKIHFLGLLKEFYMKKKLDISSAKATTNIFIGFLMFSSKKVVDELDETTKLQYFCIICYRDIIQCEKDEECLTGLLECSFRHLQKNVVASVANKEAAYSSLMVLIKYIIDEVIDPEKFNYVLDAFVLIWSKEGFTEYEQAVKIMNVLKPDHYKELMNRMVTYTRTLAHRRFHGNIMSLLYAIAKNLPCFPIGKLQVLYSCALNNVIRLFIDKVKKNSNKAIETVSLLLSLKDNPLIQMTLQEGQYSGRIMNTRTLLLAYAYIADEKWGATPRNQQLLIIMAKMLPYSKNVSAELVRDGLGYVCRGCTPNSLKSSLNTLHELFSVLSLKQQNRVAKEILKLIYQMAIHPHPASFIFAKHIFYSLVNPTMVDNVIYEPEYYCKAFLVPGDFDYDKVFIKCQNLISHATIEAAIARLNYMEPSTALLLTSMMRLYRYSAIENLGQYVTANFLQISSRPFMGPLAVAFKLILENRVITAADYPKLDVIQSLIVEALFEQNFPVNCIKSSYELYQKIRQLLQLDQEENIINKLAYVTSKKTFNKVAFNACEDNSIIMYCNEICLILQRQPSDQVIRMMEKTLGNNALKSCMPDIYLQLVTMFTTIAMMKKNNVPQALRYLRTLLNDDEQIIKILGFKLFYSLCQEITHEFEEVLIFAFREVVRADPCLVRICIITIEECIHDDYIKLCSENFFRFIYVLGCSDVFTFMKDTLMKRYVLSNQNDIAKYYVQTLMYMHIYSKLPNYPISAEFDEDLIRIKVKMDNPKELPKFLFSVLPIKKKFNVLSEIANIFEDLVRGQCKVDENFFDVMRDLIATFKFATEVAASKQKNYYKNICKMIEKQIVTRTSTQKVQCYYAEFETEIKKCTLALLNLLFYENKQVADNIELCLFDAIMQWIDFVKYEIIHYIHIERGKDYGSYFSKLIQYYKRNSGKFVIPDR